MSLTKFISFGIICLGLSGCLKDRFANLPIYYRGTKTIAGDVHEISAVNFGMRKGDEFYRIRFQIFTDMADNRPEVFALRFRDGSDSTIWLDFSEDISNGLQLKVNDSCASRNDPAIELCWSDEEVSLTILDEDKNYKLKRDRGPLDEEIFRNKDLPWTVKELVARTRLRNYKSAEEAISVFQAKERIAEARGNLFPHFNMRDLIAVATDGPLGLIGAVGDLLPFIFPTHWNEWSKSRELYQAEILSFAALLANEMNTVEGLFYVVHRDQQMLNFLDAQIEELVTYEQALQRLEARGVLRPGSTADFGLALKSFQKDRRQLASLIEKELAILAEATALSPIYERIDIAQMELPDMSNVIAPDARDHIEKIKARSPELATLYFLQKAALVETGQKEFGFLDPHSGDFFGLGRSHSVRIAAAEVEKLKIRSLAMATGLERRAIEVAEEMDEALDVHQIATRGLDDVERRLDQEVRQPMERGTFSLLDSNARSQVLELHRKAIEFEASRLSSAHAYLIAQSKWNRLLLSGFYDGLEVVDIPRPR